MIRPPVGLPITPLALLRRAVKVLCSGLGAEELRNKEP
jgi:hypothetical protein